MGALEAAVEGGVDVIVLCDTNGGTMVHEVSDITSSVVRALSTPIGIHTHNDCELGVANALAAIRAGATQVQGTINGYGERTGNCNLTSVIPNLQLKLGEKVDAGIEQAPGSFDVCRRTSQLSAQHSRPYVGTTAFTHKGGLHAHAVQKVARSYEHIEPQEVGNHQHIVVSELSGQSNVLAKTRELGFEFEKGSANIAAILQEVKRLEHLGYEFEAAEASFELLIRRILRTDRTFLGVVGISLHLHPVGQKQL